MAKGAGKHLRPKLRKAAKSAGKGAAERLYESYCLTLLSEATGEARRKRPADGERRARRSRKAAKSGGKGAADRL